MTFDEKQITVSLLDLLMLQDAPKSVLIINCLLKIILDKIKT